MSHRTVTPQPTSGEEAVSPIVGLSRKSLGHFALLGLLAVIWAVPAAGVQAQALPPVRMRIELLSIRNRSASPIPVQIKLEYNQPQVLEGDLELQLFDALDVVGTEDLLATLRHEDIVLSGTDYIFNTILPPLNTSEQQNLAVMAWLHTKTERIPLSSSVKELDPPLPHDLLMISPGERAALLCSASGMAAGSAPSVNRHFLDRALSLENYNPLAEQKSATDEAAGRSNSRSFGRNIQFYAVSWNSRDLPEDPLLYCCFDLVLLVDGALARLSSAQMAALLTWVRAGGSLCIVPDEPMKAPHLEFVRSLLPDLPGTDNQLALDDRGQLTVIGANDGRVLYGSTGLGRTVLLPSAPDLSTVLDPVERGHMVAHLWKVKQNVPVRDGQNWGAGDLVSSLRSLGVQAGQDDRGLYLENGTPNQNRRYRQRVYYPEQRLREMYQIDERLAPVRDPLITAAMTALMPEDVEMVPAWVIGVILTAYVLTIGPVDYYVLGYFRIRKATWLLFPLVTAFFTLLTIWVAHWYMGSTETGGSIELTDIIDDGQPIRRSRIEMAFYGSQTTHRTEYRQQLVVGVSTSQAGQAPVLHYSGHFPGTYSVSQTVQQWSPQLLRVFELNPSDVRLPDIDWQDTSLVTTPDGRIRLAQLLQSLDGPGDARFAAVVLHQSEQLPVVSGELFRDPLSDIPYVNPWNRFRMRSDLNLATPLLPCLAQATVNPQRYDLFRIVSRVSPQGSDILEDLPLLDPADESQWALLIVRYDHNRYQVFRKLYVVPATPPSEQSE